MIHILYYIYLFVIIPLGKPIEKISCLANGHWSAQPLCLASQCPPLPEVAHANVSIFIIREIRSTVLYVRQY